MDCQIALQLVRQGASNEPAIVEAQVVEPEETQVGCADESSQKLVESETRAAPVEDSSHEQITETSVEADAVPIDLPTDQPSDSKVSKKLGIFWNRVTIKDISHFEFSRVELKKKKNVCRKLLSDLNLFLSYME